MKLYKHQDFIGGWFVGDFSPAILSHKEVEIAVKYYRKGDCEEAHVHRIATEITVIVEGRVSMQEKEFEKGDIIALEPGEATNFLALTDCITVVVKTPSVSGDKYWVGRQNQTEQSQS